MEHFAARFALRVQRQVHLGIARDAASIRCAELGAAILTAIFPVAGEKKDNSLEPCGPPDFQIRRTAFWTRETHNNDLAMLRNAHDNCRCRMV